MDYSFLPYVDYLAHTGQHTVQLAYVDYLAHTGQHTLEVVFDPKIDCGGRWMSCTGSCTPHFGLHTVLCTQHQHIQFSGPNTQHSHSALHLTQFSVPDTATLVFSTSSGALISISCGLTVY